MSFLFRNIFPLILLAPIVFAGEGATSKKGVLACEQVVTKKKKASDRLTLLRALEYLPEGYKTKKLGEGGVGEVFRAYRHPGEAVYAIKVTFSDLDGEYYKSFSAYRDILNEPEFRLRSVEVAHIDPEGRFLIYKFVEGKSLSSFVFSPLFHSKTGRRLFLAQWNLMNGMGRALQVFHAHNLIHNDAKLDNFFAEVNGLSSYPLIRLLDIDFISRPRDLRFANVGFKKYITPIEEHRVTKKKDLYSLKFSTMEMLLTRFYYEQEPKSYAFDSLDVTRSPYSVDPRISPLLSLISFFDFETIEDYLESLQYAYRAYEDQNETYFYEYFYKKYLKELPIEQRAKTILNSPELKNAYLSDSFNLGVLEKLRLSIYLL